MEVIELNTECHMHMCTILCGLLHFGKACLLHVHRQSGITGIIHRLSVRHS